MITTISIWLDCWFLMLIKNIITKISHQLSSAEYNAHGGDYKSNFWEGKSLVEE